MKITKSKKDWINKKVKYYCSLLQIEPPQVFLTMAEYNCWKIDERRYKGERVGRTNFLGVCHRLSKIIVILVKKSSCLNCLDDTIRHELLHYAEPSYNHFSNIFHAGMKKLKKGKIKNGLFY